MHGHGFHIRWACTSTTAAGLLRENHKSTWKRSAVQVARSKQPLMTCANVAWRSFNNSIPKCATSFYQFRTKKYCNYDASSGSWIVVTVCCISGPKHAWRRQFIKGLAAKCSYVWLRGRKPADAKNGIWQNATRLLHLYIKTLLLHRRNWQMAKAIRRCNDEMNACWSTLTSSNANNQYSKGKSPIPYYCAVRDWNPAPGRHLASSDCSTNHVIISCRRTSAYFRNQQYQVSTYSPWN